MDSKLFTLHTIETFWNKIKNKFYVKSANGIPKSDLDTTVQSSLSKADSALQEHQDISGKQDKSTAVTHSANTGVGSTTKPVYVTENGVATAISHSINSDVPANAKFTDTTYGDATESTHGLMTAADKKKLDGMDLTKYLPLSGGVMTGDIDMQTNKKDILVGTQKANVSDGTAVAGGIIEKRANMTSTLPEMRSFIGSFHNTDNDKFFNLISVRHRNGCTDGNAYGMYLYSILTSNDSLRWNKQISANKWQGDRVLLDDVNFTNYALAKDGTAKKAEAMSNGTLRSGFYVNSAANATSGYTWFRMATCKISGAYESVNTTFLITNGVAYHALLTCGIRNNGTGKAVESCTLWLSARNSIDIPPSMFRVVAINSSTGVTYELWGQISARWQGVRYTVLDERNISGGKYNIWTLESHSDADAKIAPTIGNYYVDSSDHSICATAARANEATTLIDSGWVDLPLTDTNGTVYPSTSSSVKIRKYGKLVYLQATTKYSSAFSKSHYIAKIPKKYCPTTQDIHLYVPGMAQPSKTIFFFGTLTIVDEDYILEFTPADSGSSTTFNPAMSYTVHMTYFID